MELGRERRGRGWVSTATASGLLWVSFCFCLYLRALLADAGRTPTHSAAAASCGRGKDFPSPMQKVPAATAASEEEAWRRSTMATTTRRYLVGPGSYPPRCTSKCGDCTPCKPVHVPVPPGTPVITEYYPEAWRCKCGSKFYMP